MGEPTTALTPVQLERMDAYRRATNYVSVGQIYLRENPLLKEPLKLSDVKNMLLGHLGTTPGQNFIYVHLNRIIKQYDLGMIYIAGPGHGGPAVVGNTHLEGIYSEVYPEIRQSDFILPELKIRVVNVVDLMTLQPQSEHPHGMSDADFDGLFTRDKPIIFAFHGYPWLIHRLTYRRTNHSNIHVRGYKEEGTINTPFDMTVLNDMDRCHLTLDVIDRVPKAGVHGHDMPEIRDWQWGVS